MAKSLRSKAKRRLRTVRREHHQETRGKQDMLRIAARLHNPFYDLKTEFAPRVNAFVEPTNPDAIFPQIAKPDILDFRSHKMAKGGYAATNVFRKHLSEKSIKSKYTSVVRTAEEIEAQQAEAAKADQDFEDVEDEEPAKAVSSKRSKYTVNDIMELGSKLKISKKKKENDVAMEEKSKPIKKKKGPQHTKKSHKIVKF